MKRRLFHLSFTPTLTEFLFVRFVVEKTGCTTRECFLKLSAQQVVESVYPEWNYDIETMLPEKGVHTAALIVVDGGAAGSSPGPQGSGESGGQGAGPQDKGESGAQGTGSRGSGEAGGPGPQGSGESGAQGRRGRGPRAAGFRGVWGPRPQRSGAQRSGAQGRGGSVGV